MFANTVFTLMETFFFSCTHFLLFLFPSSVIKVTTHAFTESAITVGRANRRVPRARSWRAPWPCGCQTSGRCRNTDTPGDAHTGRANWPGGSSPCPQPLSTQRPKTSHTAAHAGWTKWIKQSWTVSPLPHSEKRFLTSYQLVVICHPQWRYCFRYSLRNQMSQKKRVQWVWFKCLSLSPLCLLSFSDAHQRSPGELF